MAAREQSGKVVRSDERTIKPRGLVLENDGEVAVFLPLRVHGDIEHPVKSYSHAQTQRRGDVTLEDFLEFYPLMDGDAAAQF